MKQYLAIGLLIIGALFVAGGFAQKVSHQNKMPRSSFMTAAISSSHIDFLRKAGAGQTARPDGAGQAMCTLTTAQAPEIGGLRLGMTAEQVLAVFPGSSEDSEVRAQVSKPPSPLGVSSLIIKPEKYASKAKFAGIRELSFTLLDGHVTTFGGVYNGPQWKHVDEFIAKFSEGRTLPAADAWEAYVGMDTQLKTLKCQGLEVAIFAGGDGGNLNSVRIEDTVARQTLKDRKAKAREKAKESAKP